jgi:hypothetical protein
MLVGLVEAGWAFLGWVILLKVGGFDELILIICRKHTP